MKRLEWTVDETVLTMVNFLVVNVSFLYFSQLEVLLYAS